MTKQLEPIYTLAEAAEKMRLKPRTLAKFAQERGLCSVRGRVILLSESDLVAAWEAMRVVPTSRFASTHHVPMSEERLFKKLTVLTAKKPRNQRGR